MVVSNKRCKYHHIKDELEMVGLYMSSIHLKIYLLVGATLTTEGAKTRQGRPKIMSHTYE